MAIIQLKKQFKLAWNSDKIILLNSDEVGNIAISNASIFEADTKAEINAKITELGLTAVQDV